MDVSPKGSRIGLVDGRTGQVLISPNFTDNAPILACRILRQPQGSPVFLNVTGDSAEIVNFFGKEMDLD